MGALTLFSTFGVRADPAVMYFQISEKIVARDHLNFMYSQMSFIPTEPSMFRFNIIFDVSLLPIWTVGSARTPEEVHLYMCTFFKWGFNCWVAICFQISVHKILTYKYFCILCLLHGTVYPWNNENQKNTYYWPKSTIIFQF